MGPVAGAGTISEISEIRKILEIATGLKKRFHILKITIHLAHPKTKTIERLELLQNCIAG